MLSMTVWSEISCKERPKTHTPTPPPPPPAPIVTWLRHFGFLFFFSTQNSRVYAVSAAENPEYSEVLEYWFISSTECPRLAAVLKAPNTYSSIPRVSTAEKTDHPRAPRVRILRSTEYAGVIESLQITLRVRWNEKSVMSWLSNMFRTVHMLMYRYDALIHQELHRPELMLVFSRRKGNACFY